MEKTLLAYMLVKMAGVIRPNPKPLPNLRTVGPAIKTPTPVSTILPQVHPDQAGAHRFHTAEMQQANASNMQRYRSFREAGMSHADAAGEWEALPQGPLARLLSPLLPKTTWMQTAPSESDMFKIKVRGNNNQFPRP